MREPCSSVEVTLHPGSFEMQVLKALAHLREAAKLADTANSWPVNDAIRVLRKTCRQRQLVAKVLEEPACVAAPSPRRREHRTVGSTVAGNNVDRGSIELLAADRLTPEKPVEDACELVVCEDPQTGEVIVKPKGTCPRGFVERIRDKTSQNGLTFIIPKVYSREE